MYSFDLQTKEYTLFPMLMPLCEHYLAFFIFVRPDAGQPAGHALTVSDNHMWRFQR